VWNCARRTEHQVSDKHFLYSSDTVFPTRPEFNAVSFLKYGVALKEFIAGHKM
jgi:hypothetical protein